MTGQTLFFALLAGILPALFWLWFWLHEDKKRPEPRGRLVLTFIGGMIATIVVLPIEKYIQNFAAEGTVLILILWALAEELVKYISAYFTSLRSKDNNEPIDVVIYLITVALGFAAMENTLFLLTPLGDGQIVQTFLTGNMRFIGATVLHTLSSGIAGAVIAFSFYKKKIIKKEFVFIGLILATLLHTLFNFLIIKSNGGNIFNVFLFVWILVIVLILLFEKIKRIRPKKHQS